MKDYAKYLCVMIDSNLVWKYHTQSICHKMRKEKQLTTTITTKTWVLQLSQFDIVSRVTFYFQYTIH